MMVRKLSLLLALLGAGLPPARGAAPPRVARLGVPAAALVYDPSSRRIYAAVGSDASLERANSVVIVDPFRPRVERAVFIGGDPGQLVLSAGNRYLYVQLRGAGGVRRYDLATHVAGAAFADEAGAPVVALAPFPGDPESVVVTRRTGGGTATAVYTRGAPRPGAVAAGAGLAAGIAPARLYSRDGERPGAALVALQLGTEGARVAWRQEGLLGNAGPLLGANGLLFSGGSVFDPEAGLGLGELAGAGRAPVLAPDPARGRAFQLLPGRIAGYSLRTLAPDGDFSVSDAAGGHSLIRWGDDGLAFSTGRQLVLARADLGPRLPEVDLGVERLGLPGELPPGVPVTYQLAVTNHGRAPASATFLAERLPPGGRVLAVKASQGEASAAGGLARAALGALTAGERATLEVTAQLAGPGRGFSAAVRGFEPDPRPENNLALERS